MARSLHKFAYAPNRPAVQAALQFPLRAALLSTAVFHTASSSKARALTRFWRWQITRRLGAGNPVLVECNPGGLLVVPRWSQSGGMIIAAGSHEPKETGLLDRLIAPGDVFVDVGSNIGFYAVRYAVAGAEVIAFEPMQRAADACLTSARLAGVEKRLHVEPCALADEDDDAWFMDGGDVGNSLGPPGEGRKVPVRRLDTLTAHIREPSPGCMTIVKIDAEGADLRVLEGARTFIGQRRPIIMVEAWNGGWDIRKLLAECDYEVFRAADSELAPLPDAFPHINIFAVSRDQLVSVQDRLAGAPKTALLPPRVLSWSRR